MFQTSTSEGYGDPSVHRQTEDYRGNFNLTGSRACYDEGKRCAETLFFDYARQHRVRIKVVLIFNIDSVHMRTRKSVIESSPTPAVFRACEIFGFSCGLSIYSPRMHPNDGRVVSNVIVRASRDNDITVYGDGSQTRAFYHVDDLINGFVHMMDASDVVLGQAWCRDRTVVRKCWVT